MVRILNVKYAVDVQRQRHMKPSEKQKPAEAGFF